MAQDSAQPVGAVEVPASEHGRGFPPFDSQTFPSQLFWLAIAFIALYLLMARIALPRIGSILEARCRRVEDDLAEAQHFKDASEEKTIAGTRSAAMGNVRSIASE